MTTYYRALCAELVDIVTAHANPDDDAVGYVAAVLTRARAVLDAEPESPADETEFAWELQNASGDWQAGGSGNDLQIAQREGMRYLHQYSLDGEHTLIIRKHEITTISEVTYG